MGKIMRLSLLALIPLAVAAALFCTTAQQPAKADEKGRIWAEGPTSNGSGAAAFDVRAGFADLVEKLKPSVVNIYTTTIIKGQRFFPRSSPFDDFFGDELFRRFFGEFEIPPQKRNSLGSGFIVAPDGYILTNNHVVAGATEIAVKLVSGKEYKARIVGRDEKYDLALLKIEPQERLPIAVFGDSDKLRVGDWVIAIGNPFGLAHTVTVGIVSAKDRVIGAGPFDDFIQTDASINPGNSGGPLFDTNGLVVGINTAIHAAGQGIGFAVPINFAKRFIQDVLTRGRVTYGWLGVGIQDLTPELAQGLGLSVTAGVLVSQVFKDSPAEKGGMKRGDVIVAFDGKPVERAADLSRLVGTTPPGNVVTIKVVREGKEKEIKVTIAERPSEEAMAEGAELGEGGDAGLGLEVAPLNEAEARRLRLPLGQGVVVRHVAPEGAAAGSGIRPGDIILEVNRVPVGSPSEFSAAVAKVRSKEPVLLLVLRGRGYFYVVVQKP